MEYLNEVVLSGVIYDVFKHHAKLASDKLKASLKGWLISEDEIQAIVERVNKIENIEDLNEKAIAQRLKNDEIIQKIIQNVKQDNSSTTVQQNHSGRGDNVAGNKVITQNNYKRESD